MYSEQTPMTNLNHIEILLIEDNLGDAKQVQFLLEDVTQNTFDITHVESIAAALPELFDNPPDVILLDLSLPDSTGMDTVNAILSKTKSIPIVILSGLDDNEIAMQAVKSGAQDYLIKSATNDGDSIAKCIRYAIERKKSEEKLAYLANYDQLTGLSNRSNSQDALAELIELKKRENKHIALLFLDLDRFKVINDSLGHAYGDILLQKTSKRLITCTRKGDVVGRIGGDEFIIILKDIADPAEAGLVARKILQAMAPPFSLNGQEVFVTTSIGIATYPGNGVTHEELTKNADSAMYHAKATGRNNFAFYDPEMNNHINEQLQFENDLRKAVDKQEFVLYFQPQIDFKNKQIVGVEALIRWQHPSQGLLAPDTFIPLAEETELIHRIGEFALRSACEQGVRWKENGNPINVAVNFSCCQLWQDNLLGIITQTLRDTKFTPELLELEITESSLMKDKEQAIKLLKNVHDLGIKISIDDFGTGYSSLGQLKHLPIDALKIDKSFIDDVAQDRDDAVIVETIISMAKHMELDVVAEGVENKEQINYLVKQGCNNMQGYYFCHPIPGSKLDVLLGKPIKKK